MNEKNTLCGVTSAHPEYNDDQVQAMLDAIIQEDERRQESEVKKLRDKVQWLEETSAFYKNLCDSNWQLYTSAEKSATFWKNLYEEEKGKNA